MDYFDPTGPAFWNTVGFAITCGGIVGGERQLRGKACGIRTSILVCLSTAVFIHLGASAVGTTGDPTRVLSQLVTGVGFLGAGVMFARDGSVVGVTTAAVIWALASIGAAIGLGHVRGAVVLSLLTVVVLVGVEWLESSIRWLARGVHAREQPPEP